MEHPSNTVMPKDIQRHPLKYQELLKRLKPFGIVVRIRRGKGSHRVLLKPVEPGSTKGPTYAVNYHGPRTEISVPMIKAILRKFEIPEQEFW